MKPVLFIAFLALGPALGEQLRVVPALHADTVETVDPITDPISDAAPLGSPRRVGRGVTPFSTVATRR